MSDNEDTTVDEQLNVKELRRRQARSRYKRAKELYENSKYGIKQKAKLKDLRKAAYAKAKEKRNSARQNERDALVSDEYESIQDQGSKIETFEEPISKCVANADELVIPEIDFSKVKLKLVYSAD